MKWIAIGVLVIWIIMLALAMSACTKPVTVSDTTTTKSSTDTTRTQVTVNIPKSEVKVELNVDSLVGAAKSQGKTINLKGSSGRSGYDISLRPNGMASVDCHCDSVVVRYMQEVIRLMVEKDRTVVQKDQPTTFGSFIKDFQNNLFWLMFIVLGGIIFYVVKKLN